METLDEKTKLKDGYYQILLKFKQEYVILPCNQYEAAQGMSYLRSWNSEEVQKLGSLE